MGMEFEVDNLEDMCALMCDNYIPKRKKVLLKGSKIKEPQTDFPDIEQNDEEEE